MNVNVDIISCGTPVITKMGKIKAIITGVSVRGQNTSYELSYFNNGVYTQPWLYRYEFEVNESSPKQAGFNYNNEQKLLIPNKQ